MKLDKPTFLKALRGHGNVGKAAEEVGVSRGAVYKARDADPGFAEAWEDTLERTVDDLAESAFEQARSGEAPMLVKFLLQAHRPSLYREPKGLAEEERRELIREYWAIMSRVAYAMFSADQAQAFEVAMDKELTPGPKAIESGA